MLNILWSIYLAFLGITAIGLLVKGSYNTTVAKLDFVFSIVTWIGLFGYVTNNQIFTPLIWKFVFVGGLIWDVVFGIKKFNEETVNEDIPPAIRTVIIVCLLLILIGPLYFGLFNYAFK
ncbi:hypothetical protein [Bacillus sp. V2I10]|uniref:hypothetical protein n=1 Tax=Bacillus sp. V2I10 TaxID=3042276 RepID=UPI002786F970|nr:hypothetical protein [Bacillus sp. V2I10]MDQ0859717.1 putative membrane protein YiaA [Bacillus sp. V2I10]